MHTSMYSQRGAILELCLLQSSLRRCENLHRAINELSRLDVTLLELAAKKRRDCGDVKT